MRRSGWIVALAAGAVTASPLVVASAGSVGLTDVVGETCSAPPSSDAPSEASLPVDSSTQPNSTPPTSEPADDAGDDHRVEAAPTSAPVESVVEQAAPTTVGSGQTADAQPVTPTSAVTDAAAGAVTVETAPPETGGAFQPGGSSAIGLRRADRAGAVPPAPAAPLAVAPPPRPVQVIRLHVVASANSKGIVFYELRDASGKRDECNPLRVSFHASDLRGTNRNIRIGNVRNQQCRLVSFTIGGRPDPTAVLVDEPIQPAEGPRYMVPSIHYTSRLRGVVLASEVIEVEVHCTAPAPR